MSFFVSESDFICHYDVAYEYIGKMSTKTNIIDVDYYGHYYFADDPDNHWFMPKLLEQLAITYL
jgi:hypothetical protein